MIQIANPVEPSIDCRLCPRLAGFRSENRAQEPSWHNGPVPSFGSAASRLLIVGLAPGLKGANRTGRPFTGDFAGDLLYSTLAKYGFARGTYGATASDGLELADCRITNAVRCVPPQNKPVPAEIRACNGFLAATLQQSAKLAAVVALGRIAHDAVLAAAARRKSEFRFSHGSQHRLGEDVVLFDSYHCSRYNTNTGVLTEPMFHAVFAEVRAYLDRH